MIEPLCNFNAQVREELVLDDGEDETREFRISCTLDSEKQMPDARVPAERNTRSSIRQAEVRTFPPKLI